MAQSSIESVGLGFLKIYITVPFKVFEAGVGDYNQQCGAAPCFRSKSWGLRNKAAIPEFYLLCKKHRLLPKFLNTQTSFKTF